MFHLGVRFRILVTVETEILRPLNGTSILLSARQAMPAPLFKGSERHLALDVEVHPKKPLRKGWFIRTMRARMLCLVALLNNQEGSGQS